MSALLELQRAFRDAVFEPDTEDRLLSRFEEDPETGRRRLAAYRNSVVGNLVAALSSTYPVVERVVGGAFFREAARCYASAAPSVSGDLNDYGVSFADFLAGYAPASELAYLPDVARLEWQVQAVYYAADPSTADLTLLATTPPARLGELRFSVAPAHARLDSPWPLDRIWAVHREGYAGDMVVDFSRGCRLLVLRHGGLVHVEALDDGEAAFFDALVRGATLGEAAAQPDLDLEASLRRFITDGLLVGTSLEPVAAISGVSS